MALSTRRLPSLLRGPGEPSSPALGSTTKALRLPIRASAVTYWIRFRSPPDPPASCSPQRSCKVGGPFQARALGVPAARLAGCSRVDANGISQVSRRSFPCLCSAPRPRSNRCVLANSATSMLPPLCAQRRLRRLAFRGSLTQLRHPLTYASRFVSPLTRKARFRLAGWPLPGGHRTLRTATRGFSSCSPSSPSPVLLTLVL
jgi:hypothetical protein